jgi:hypothetical protein
LVGSDKLELFAVHKRAEFASIDERVFDRVRVLILVRIGLNSIFDNTYQTTVSKPHAHKQERLACVVLSEVAKLAIAMQARHSLSGAHNALGPVGFLTLRCSCVDADDSFQVVHHGEDLTRKTRWVKLI